MKKQRFLSLFLVLCELCLLSPLAMAQELFIQPVTNLSTPLTIHQIIQTGDSGSTLLVASDQGVFATDDRGENWIKWDKGLPTGEVLQLLYQSQPLLILASVKNYGVWKWQPAGKNWVSFNSNLPAKQVLSFYKTDKYIYAGSNKEGLFRVKVGSEKWQDLNFDDKNPFLSQLSIRAICFIDEKTGWLGSDKGLVFTDDEGELWKHQESNLLNNVTIFTLLFHPIKKLFLVGTQQKGIYTSQDSGRTWKEWRPSGIPAQSFSVYTMALDTASNRLWIGTDQGGWISNESINLFEPLTDLSNTEILSIFPTNLNGWNSIWIGTVDKGLYYACSVKPPTRPSQLAYSIGPLEVHLRWKESAPGSQSIAGYTIYRKRKSEASYQVVGDSQSLDWTDRQVQWLDEFYYTVQAYDSQEPPARSILSEEILVLVDDEPTLTLKHPPENFITTEESISINGSATDQGSGIQSVNLTLTYESKSNQQKSFQLNVHQDGTFEQTIPLELGKNTLYMEASDNRSHQVSISRTVIRNEVAKDTTPPVITINSPADHFTNEAGTMVVTGKIVDEEGHLLESRIWVEQKGNRLHYRVITLDQKGLFSETVSLPFGEVSIIVQAIDAFGNQGEKKLSGMNIEPDLIPPQYYILSPLQGAETEEETIRFYGRAWDDESGILSIQVSLDYLSKRMYDKTLTLNDQGFFDMPLTLMEGENLLTLHITDNKKNESKESRTVIRKAKPKTILIELIIGKNTALVNGQEMTLAYPPEIQKGRTFVPVRFVSEALGANVLWIAQRKEIQITWKEKFISLWLNKTIVTIESLTNPNEVPKTVFLEHAPYLAKGVTMVPLRLIAEQFGITPDWDPVSQRISLILIP